MRVKSTLRMFWLFACCSLGFALPAMADVTVLARYTLVNGDTLTRASYYSSRRVRVTAPDGKEFIYDSKSDQVTVINHPDNVYWTGPLSQADSIATRMLNASRREIGKVATQDLEAWTAKIQSFNDSIKVTRTEKTSKIAGYPTTQWLLSAGPYMQHERWVARSLAVANYGPELERVVMASIMDPLGQVLMKMLIGLRSADGLPLAAKTSFRTPSRSGSFSFEAVRVIGTSIPATAWEIPKDYARIEL